MTGTADALSAASVLLAALALVYNAWALSIDGAISKQLGTTDGEIARNKDAVRRVRNGRAIPIAVACWAMLTVFLPRDFDILSTAGACARQSGCTYDDVAAVFLLTQCLVLGAAIFAWRQIGRLNEKL